MSENEKLSEFYEELTQAQEELGAEFSKVLFDNLWDLYDQFDSFKFNKTN